MKRNSFLMIAALTMLASCSKDEIVGHQDDLPIQFRTVIEKQTRATSYTTNTLNSFSVTAFNDAEKTFIMKDAEYSRSSGNSSVFLASGETKYYWPKTADVKFYAYAPKAADNNGVTFISESNRIKVEPLSDTDGQKDVLYAANIGCKSLDATSGVSLNFRHAMSKIEIRVKNSNSKLKFNVTGWKIAGVDGSASFKLDYLYDTSTSASGSLNTLDRGIWTDNDDDYNADYSKTFSTKEVTSANSTWKTLTGSAILIPQDASKATAYSGSDPGNNALNGAYIAIQYQALDGTDAVVVPAGTWGCWPVSFSWQPGFRYLYTVDLAELGYSEKGTDDLEPVIENLDIEMKFVDVTVDAWQPEDDDEANTDVSTTDPTVNPLTGSYLRFHTSGGTNTLSIHQDVSNTHNTETHLEYSKNEGSTWETMTFDTPIEFGHAGNGKGDLLVRGKGFYNNEYYDQSTSPAKQIAEIKYFVFGNDNQLVECSGKIGALYDYENPDADLIYEQQFAKVFWECTCLKTAPQLTATGLSKRCYFYLFKDCTNLTESPELPATSLTGADGCYMCIFEGCSNLKTAPALPAMELSYMCYESMFNSCTSLTTAPELPATTLAEACYAGMFYGCSNLETAPELPAQELKVFCYSEMFGDCSKLNYIRALFTSNENNDVDDYKSLFVDGWLDGVSSTGTFVKAPNATWTKDNVGIPDGWNLVTE